MKTRTYLGKKRSGVVLSAFLALCILILATGCKKDETQIIPDIVSITAYANPKTVSKGQTSRITISVTGNPDSISGDLPERNSISGVFSTPPLNTTTTYHFVVYKGGRGCDIANVTIVVVPVIPDPVPVLSVHWTLLDYKEVDSLPKGGCKVRFVINTQNAEQLTLNGQFIILNGEYVVDSVNADMRYVFLLKGKGGEVLKTIDIPVTRLTYVENFIFHKYFSIISERCYSEASGWEPIITPQWLKDRTIYYTNVEKTIVDYGPNSNPRVLVFSNSLIGDVWLGKKITYMHEGSLILQYESTDDLGKTNIFEETLSSSN